MLVCAKVSHSPPLLEEKYKHVDDNNTDKIFFLILSALLLLLQLFCHLLVVPQNMLHMHTGPGGVTVPFCWEGKGGIRMSCDSKLSGTQISANVSNKINSPHV